MVYRDERKNLATDPDPGARALLEWTWVKSNTTIRLPPNEIEAVGFHPISAVYLEPLENRTYGAGFESQWVNLTNSRATITASGGLMQYPPIY